MPKDEFSINSRQNFRFKIGHKCDNEWMGLIINPCQEFVKALPYAMWTLWRDFFLNSFDTPGSQLNEFIKKSFFLFAVLCHKWNEMNSRSNRAKSIQASSKWTSSISNRLLALFYCTYYNLFITVTRIQHIQLTKTQSNESFKPL